MDEADRIRRDCWDQAVDAWGTAWIFEKRSKKLRRRLGLMNFLGIAVPAVAGAVILPFVSGREYLSYVAVAAGVLGSIQLIASVWALVADWQGSLVYAGQSTADNYRLAREYRKLASNPPLELAQLRQEQELLETEYELRDRDDRQQGLTEGEKRAGMRAALRKFQRVCAGCGEVPKSLSPTDCPVCGNFKEWRIYW